MPFLFRPRALALCLDLVAGGSLKTFLLTALFALTLGGDLRLRAQGLDGIEQSLVAQGPPLSISRCVRLSQDPPGRLHLLGAHFSVEQDLAATVNGLPCPCHVENGARLSLTLPTEVSEPYQIALYLAGMEAPVAVHGTEALEVIEAPSAEGLLVNSLYAAVPEEDSWTTLVMQAFDLGNGELGPGGGPGHPLDARSEWRLRLRHPFPRDVAHAELRWPFRATRGSGAGTPRHRAILLLHPVRPAFPDAPQLEMAEPNHARLAAQRCRPGRAHDLSGGRGGHLQLGSA